MRILGKAVAVLGVAAVIGFGAADASTLVFNADSSGSEGSFAVAQLTEDHGKFVSATTPWDATKTGLLAQTFSVLPNYGYTSGNGALERFEVYLKGQLGDGGTGELSWIVWGTNNPPNYPNEGPDPNPLWPGPGDVLDSGVLYATPSSGTSFNGWYGADFAPTLDPAAAHYDSFTIGLFVNKNQSAGFKSLFWLYDKNASLEARGEGFLEGTVGDFSLKELDEYVGVSNTAIDFGLRVYASEVPEPGGLALLALGSLSVVVLRANRRRA